jgi:hypothetical protein
MVLHSFYACDVLVEHNLQVEIIFPMKQGGNICLLGVNIAADNILQNA